MKNAVIYARYSSDRQNEMSIEGQLAECRKYAEEHELNRGSVVYMNKKMVDAFADELRKRDESDGVCRLKI